MPTLNPPTLVTPIGDRSAIVATIEIYASWDMYVLYPKNAIMGHNNNIYVCINQMGSRNNEPGTSPTHWQLLIDINGFVATATAAYTGAAVRYKCIMEVLASSNTAQTYGYVIELSDNTGATIYRAQGKSTNTMDLSLDDKNLSIYGYKISGDSLDVEMVDTVLFSTYG